MKRTFVLFLLFSQSLFAQVNLNQGLVAYYPFSGNANDASGNSNNPIFNNATSSVDRFGNPNNAYSFNGIDNYIQIPNSPSLNMGSQMSIAIWVKPVGYYTGPCYNNMLVAKGEDDFSSGNYSLQFTDVYTGCTTPDATKEMFYGPDVIATKPFVQLNQWYSVVWTTDGVKSKIYVNCVLEDSASAASFPFTNASDLFLGHMNNPQFPYWFNGVMDEVRIYNRALNEDEVKAYGDCSANTVVASFNVPDTVCVNSPLQITNTSIGATSYYWNFCVADINATPTGINMGNIDGQMQKPVYIDYTYDNGNYYGFITNNYPGGLLRLDFGNSLLNTPTVTNFGSLGGVIPQNTEGLQIVNNEGNWYVIIVGGDPVVTGNISRIVKVELGPNIANNSPIATDWGNIGNLSYPHDLYVFNDNSNWYGFTVNYDNSTITRFDFTNSFSNTPTATNLGNVGNLNGPTGLHAINDNGNWYVFVTNALGSTLTRLDFGNSLLNSPTAQNLGNINGLFHTDWDIYIMKFCGEIVAFVINANQSYNDLLRLNFGNSILNIPTAVSLGNIGNCYFPHCLSKIFRVGPDLYSFITNVDNNTLTRLRFTGCTNSNIPSSTSQNPSPVTYNTPGIYNINLSIDDGLPTQTAYCKQVVVTGIDSVRIQDSSIGCSNLNFIGYGYSYPISTWQWDFGDGTFGFLQNMSHHYTSSGTYPVKLIVSDINGCRDSITKSVTTTNKPNFDYNYQFNICDPFAVQFSGIGTDIQNPYWSFGDATTITGNLNPTHTYLTSGNYNVRYAITNGTCTDTLAKIISVLVAPENLILTSDTTICFGDGKRLTTKPVLNFCWNPTTFLDDPNSPNPITFTPQNITYYFTAQVTGQNIITNGDFTTGNSGFTSEYNYSTPNFTEGEYFVGTNPSTWNGALSSCKDHTTSGGNMLLVNGSPLLNKYVWRQTVSVTPNTNYAFSTWIQSLIVTNPAQLQFSINGNDIGNLIAASLPPCNWAQFYTTWNSGNNTTATISIVNKNTQLQGNDFALDDISFAPVYLKRDSVVISVEKPVVNAFKDTTVCSNAQVPLNATGAANYSWSPSVGLNNSNIANPIASTNVTTQYIVTGITTNGCSAKDTVQISVYPKPVITKTRDTVICKNSSVQLFVTGGIIYSWSPSNSLNNNSIFNPIASPIANTTYQVKITDGNNCTNNDSIKVSIRPDPVFTINNPTNLCVNSSVELSASGGSLYSWQPSASLNNSSISNPTASPQTTTNYSVVITDTVCNNISTLSTTVTVLSLPIVKASRTNDLDCNNDHSQLIATGALQYTWSPVSTLNNSQIADPIANPTTPTIYTVKGIDANGCANYDSVKVDITDSNKSGYFMPSAFTPNNDGLNDCYGIKYWGIIEELDFAIYNRWGERIFHTTTPGDCWDGKYKGLQQNPDVYVYLITAKTFCGKVFKKGTFALIR